jgi:hypothetical protein
MQMLFWRKIFEDEHCPSPGLFAIFAAPYLGFPELSLISYVKSIEKILPLSSDWERVSSLRWDAKMEKFDTKTKFKKFTNGSINLSVET